MACPGGFFNIGDFNPPPTTLRCDQSTAVIRAFGILIAILSGMACIYKIRYSYCRYTIPLNQVYTHIPMIVIVLISVYILFWNSIGFHFCTSLLWRFLYVNMGRLKSSNRSKSRAIFHQCFFLFFTLCIVIVYVFFLSMFQL